MAIAYPTGAPFVEDWIYEYGLLDELAICAYWTGRYVECVDACDRLLSEGKLPTNMRDRILKNKQFATDKVTAASGIGPNLREIFIKWGTDKGLNYPGVYECLFRIYRHEVKRFLRLGSAP